MFSPEPSHTKPWRVEQDRLLVAGLRRLDLGQHAVQVLARGLGVRDQRVVRDPPPARDLRADAGALALLAEVGAPRPRGDRHLDRRVERVEAHLPVAAERRSGGCSTRAARWRDQLVRGRAQLLERVGDRHVVQLGRLEQPVEVVVVAEDRRCPAASRRRGSPRTPRSRSAARASVRGPSRPPRRRALRCAR